MRTARRRDLRSISTIIIGTVQIDKRTESSYRCGLFFRRARSSRASRHSLSKSTSACCSASLSGYSQSICEDQKGSYKQPERAYIQTMGESAKCIQGRMMDEGTHPSSPTSSTIAAALLANSARHSGFTRERKFCSTLATSNAPMPMTRLTI